MKFLFRINSYDVEELVKINKDGKSKFSEFIIYSSHESTSRCLDIFKCIFNLYFVLFYSKQIIITFLDKYMYFSRSSEENHLDALQFIINAQISQFLIITQCI